MTRDAPSRNGMPRKLIAVIATICLRDPVFMSSVR